MKNERTAEDCALIRISFARFAVTTVCLPSISLLLCFFSGVLFQFYDVNETVCNVTNFIPSISAVTGITPQRYLWRICIALHCTPRFAVAFMYFNMYKGFLQSIKKEHQSLFLTLIKVNFWLNIMENSSLIGVTYISNKENYPIHEKIFIVFMATSLCYMLLNTILFRWTRDKVTEADEKSFKWKVLMFCSIMVATAGLLFFFVKHRFHCEPLAFSWFSLCEYVIAYTNMGFHMTAAYDFRNVTFYACTPAVYSTLPINGMLVNNNKKQR
ncbi:post-GPI attachment to proteins factor 2-like [Octopus sinensis]|uniref:Post-GPI attachment to proteins factor 2-like n=1 Tax=Octopus sinensis TaxID=2607531 RepID=A0A6P7T104_9MOLL|nr:post-GPI attachment to proteins factor 2-like [Octopus sinensis]